MFFRGRRLFAAVKPVPALRVRLVQLKQYIIFQAQTTRTPRTNISLPTLILYVSVAFDLKMSVLSKHSPAKRLTRQVGINFPHPGPNLLPGLGGCARLTCVVVSLRSSCTVVARKTPSSTPIRYTEILRRASSRLPFPPVERPPAQLLRVYRGRRWDPLMALPSRTAFTLNLHGRHILQVHGGW